jgi:hypothetical protein
MMHPRRLTVEFFTSLERLDMMIAAKVAAGGCQHCGGPLHQGNYQRKPRGGSIALTGEAFTRRHSLCCGRRGCRKRALPPSLRFLGRRVYLEVVVVLASVLFQVLATARAAEAASGVPLRTLRRWRSRWSEVSPRLPTWRELRARFAPPTMSALGPVGFDQSRRHHRKPRQSRDVPTQVAGSDRQRGLRGRGTLGLGGPGACGDGRVANGRPPRIARNAAESC